MEVFDNPAFGRDDTEQIADTEQVAGTEQIAGTEQVADTEQIDDSPTDVWPATAVVGQGQAPLIDLTDVSQQQELLQGAVDDYYNALSSKQGLTPALGRDTSKFELVDGRLRLKAYPSTSIINSKTGGPLAFSTIARKPGGGR